MQDTAKAFFDTVMTADHSRFEVLSATVLQHRILEWANHYADSREIELAKTRRLAGVRIIDEQGKWLSRLKVSVNSQALAVAIKNLLRNAIDNWIERGEEAPLDLEIVISFIRRRGNELEIRIRDDGGGCSRHVLAKLQDQFSFYSKKRSGKSGGLGLFLCRWVAVRHGGKFAVDSDFVRHFQASITFRPLKRAIMTLNKSVHRRQSIGDSG